MHATLTGLLISVKGGKKDADEQKTSLLLFDIFINRMYSCIPCMIKNKFVSKKQ